MASRFVSGFFIQTDVEKKLAKQIKLEKEKFCSWIYQIGSPYSALLLPMIPTSEVSLGGRSKWVGRSRWIGLGGLV